MLFGFCPAEVKECARCKESLDMARELHYRRATRTIFNDDTADGVLFGF
jgi:hypothetical protein